MQSLNHYECKSEKSRKNAMRTHIHVPFVHKESIVSHLLSHYWSSSKQFDRNRAFYLNHYKKQLHVPNSNGNIDAWSKNQIPFQSAEDICGVRIIFNDLFKVGYLRQNFWITFLRGKFFKLSFLTFLYSSLFYHPLIRF